MHYLYLHGFASSPQSAKAQFLRKCFASRGLNLTILDLNQGDFGHLTLTRQIQQGVAYVQGCDRVTIIGSSLGGLTAAWIAQDPQVNERIEHLVLLAPAFQFLAQWLPRLGTETLTQWQSEGWLPIYHYGFGRKVPLSYQFVLDAQQYRDDDLNQAIPTLIIHGVRDEVIALAASQAYAATRPWVRLVTVESDHQLTDVQSEIWEVMEDFLGLAAVAKEF